MSKCNLRKKWPENLEELTDMELDLLIDHSSVCSFHADVLTDYERSILPILRAALPEKVVSYRPFPEPKSFSRRILARIASFMRTYVRREIIQDYVSHVRAQTRLLGLSPLADHHGARQFRFNPASNFIGALFILAFLTVFGIASVIIYVNQGAAVEGMSQAERTEKIVQSPQPPTGVKRQEPGTGACAFAPKTKNPQQVYRSPQGIVNVSYDSYNVEDKVKTLDKKDDVEKPEEKQLDDIQKTWQDEASRLPDTGKKVQNRHKILAFSLKARTDAHHAKVVVKVTNLSEEEIEDPRTLCEAVSKDGLKSLGRNMIAVNSDNKVAGLCIFGLPLSEDYIIRIKSDGYDLNEVDIPVGKAGAPYVIVTMQKIIDPDSMVNRQRY